MLLTVSPGAVHKATKGLSGKERNGYAGKIIGQRAEFWVLELETTTQKLGRSAMVLP